MKSYERILLTVVFLILVIFPFMMGTNSRYFVGVMILVGIYVLLAVGLDLLMGYTGQISVGHAAFFAIGAYTTGIMTTKCEWGALSALLLGIILSSGIAWLIGRAVLALKEYYLAMATLAFNEIVVTLLTGLEWLTGGGSGLRDIPAFSIFGTSLDNTTHYYYLVLGVVTLAIFISFKIVRSPYGLTLSAIHSDEMAASHFGVNCKTYKTNVFMLVAAYASVAGSLFSHYMGFIAPDDFGIMTSVNLLVMLFLGGIGTILGPALGALFLKLLPEVTYSFHDYQLFIEGSILVIVLVFIPRGMYGLFQDLGNAVFERRLR